MSVARPIRPDDDHRSDRPGSQSDTPGRDDPALHSGGSLGLYWAGSPTAPQLTADHRPQLLLLHGMGTTHADYATLARSLADEYAVLAPDLPGQGRSPALPVIPTITAISDSIEADLDRLGVDRLHILGNSIGGRVALELAARQRALSVVAVAPSGMGLPLERVYQAAALGAARVMLAPLRRLLAPASHFAVGRAMLLAGLRSAPWRAAPAEIIGLRDGLATGSDFWRLLWQCVLLDVPKGLTHIDVPVLLVQGTADVLAGGQAGRYLLQVPNAQFRVLLAAGHAPFTDRPAGLIDLVHETVARSETTTEE
jgi:pimeloyl-ACP methyl ester carboxylesterase